MTEFNSHYDDTIIYAQAEHHARPNAKTEPSAGIAYPYPGEMSTRRGRLSFTRKWAPKVWLIATIIELLIGFRIFLKLIAANQESEFVAFVYGITEPLLAPFSDLTYTPAANGSAFEISSIIAMVVYAIVFWLLFLTARIMRD